MYKIQNNVINTRNIFDMRVVAVYIGRLAAKAQTLSVMYVCP
jgi:hypothetical protein